MNGPIGEFADHYLADHCDDVALPTNLHRFGHRRMAADGSPENEKVIRLAGPTFAFGDISLEESCDVLKDLGFGLADVGASGWSTFTAYVPQQVVKDPDDPDGEATRIREVMDARGIGVSERAGFESIMMLPGNVHEDLGQTCDEAFDTSVQEYTWMQDVAQKNGLQLLHLVC